MSSSKINNDFYNHLGDRWYDAYDDPVALLRAENKKKIEWIKEKLKTHESSSELKILDVGCGAGFATNELAKSGYTVTGIDIAEEALKVARTRDFTKTVIYKKADALELPFEKESKDCVICLDFLEHTDKPEKVIKEISRVLKPKGLFFYHTFSKNLLSYLIVIKGVEWFVKNTPKNMHTLDLFINHSELLKWLNDYNMTFKEVTGLRPSLDRHFLKLLLTREVPRDFSFKYSSSTQLSYLGYAVKN